MPFPQYYGMGVSRVRYDARAGVAVAPRCRWSVALQPCRSGCGTTFGISVGTVDRAAGARGFAPLTGGREDMPEPDAIYGDPE